VKKGGKGGGERGGSGGSETVMVLTKTKKGGWKHGAMLFSFSDEGRQATVSSLLVSSSHRCSHV
jgi:hypothetical protein